MVNLSEDAKNIQTRAITALCDGGSLAIRDADDQELVRCTLGSPAFLAPVKGIAQATPIAPAIVQQSGIAEVFEVFTADGRSVFAGTVGSVVDTMGEDDMLVDTVDLRAGVKLELGGFSYGCE